MTCRALALVVAVASLAVASGKARAESEPAPATASLLETIGGDGSADARKAAIASLADTAADNLDALEAFILKRERTTTIEARRAILRSIGAAVPDKKGKFRSPKRQKEKVKTAEDQFDWMAKLLKLPAQNPAVRELVADVAVIRALAASKTVRGGDLLFRVGFDSKTMLYRDEVGRYLRRMAPYSLPALVRRAAIRRKYSSARRYAKYQLERLDLESPKKAVRSAAGDEKLLVTLLETYGDAGYRPGVAQVLAHTNHDTPSIRAAARKGWMKYVTGKAPEAPKRKLVLPGGKTTDEEKPLYLNYQEMARIELVKVHESVFGELPNRRDKTSALSEKLFAHWDEERRGADGVKIDAAIKQAADGDVAGAAAALDRLLALDDKTDKGPEIARVYLLHAKEQEKAGAWKEAAAAWRKVSALDPEGENADEAMASHYVALGKSVEAEGGDATALYAKASTIQPKHAGAHKALTGKELEETRPQWMLYAGIAGGVLAILLLVVGVVRRRATA